MAKIIDLKNSKDRTNKETGPEPIVQLVRPAGLPTPNDAPIASPTASETNKNNLNWKYQLTHALGRQQLIYFSVIIGTIGVGSWLWGYSISLIVFVALALLLLIINQKRSPETSTVDIHHGGVTINGQLIYYKDFKSFWIEYNPGGIKELSLESGRWYLPYIKVPLTDQNPTQLHAHLASYLPEKEHELSLIDIFLKRN